MVKQLNVSVVNMLIKVLPLRAIVLIWTVAGVTCQRWYSATVVERETPKLIYYGPPKAAYKRYPENIRDKNQSSLPTVNLKHRDQTQDTWKMINKHDFTSVPSPLLLSQFPSLKNVTFQYIVKKNTPMTPIVEPLVSSEWPQEDWSTIPSSGFNEIKNTEIFIPKPKPTLIINNNKNTPQKQSIVNYGIRHQSPKIKYNSRTKTKPAYDFNAETKTGPTFKFNNTIHTINVFKTKPKRKTILRGCPSLKRYPNIKTRQKKQLNLDPEARKRFLEVFEVVEFDHVACTSTSGLEGTCLPEQECLSPEGKIMGSCADGYGACCVNQLSCEARTASTSGWFINPGFPAPSTERLSCTLTLDKASPDVKQIRLDFTNFELLPPVAGTCEQDQLVVSGQNINNIIPILCGVNTGQHIYIEVGDVDGPVMLSVQTVSPDNRLFSIKFTQISGPDDLAAPPGCLQYFRGSHGVLESFNYGDKSAISIARIPSYLNNLNYAMCIEREPAVCSITYTNTDYMQIVNYDADGLPVIPPGQAGVEVFNCPTDWLLAAAVRLCGDRLNDGSILQDFALDAPVTDTSAGPIMVWFRSDGGYVGRGFRLQYQQNSC